MIHIPIEAHTLPNGLSVIFSPNRDLPVVATTFAYDVGSADEAPGKSGFAHLFEHLMFQGSENVPRNGHFKLIEAAGGLLNAFTAKEQTIYYQALPSNQLKLALWLESDRLRSLAITQENFETERSTVKEERRQIYENKAYGRSFEILDAMAHSDPAYAHSVIGSMKDLDRASLQDVRDFWQRFYQPMNARLVITGDFHPVNTLKTVEHYLGDITGRPRLPRASAIATCKAGLGEDRFRTVRDPLAELPALLMAAHMPDFGSREWYATRLLREGLTRGDSSRLHRRLVKGEGIAIDVKCQIERHRGPGLMLFTLLARPGCVRRAQTLLCEELKRLCDEGMTAVELQKTKNQFLASYVNGLASTVDRGVLIATQAMLTGTPHAINAEVARYLDVTLDEARRAARLVFDGPRVWVTVLPKGKLS